MELIIKAFPILCIFVICLFILGIWTTVLYAWKMDLKERFDNIKIQEQENEENNQSARIYHCNHGPALSYNPYIEQRQRKRI